MAKTQKTPKRVARAVIAFSALEAEKHRLEHARVRAAQEALAAPAEFTEPADVSHETSVGFATVTFGDGSEN